MKKQAEDEAFIQATQQVEMELKQKESIENENK